MGAAGLTKSRSNSAFWNRFFFFDTAVRALPLRDETDALGAGVMEFSVHFIVRGSTVRVGAGAAATAAAAAVAVAARLGCSAAAIA